MQLVNYSDIIYDGLDQITILLSDEAGDDKIYYMGGNILLIPERR